MQTLCLKFNGFYSRLSFVRQLTCWSDSEPANPIQNPADPTRNLRIVRLRRERLWIMPWRHRAHCGIRLAHQIASDCCIRLAYEVGAWGCCIVVSLGAWLRVRMWRRRACCLIHSAWYIFCSICSVAYVLLRISCHAHPVTRSSPSFVPPHIPRKWRIWID